MQIPYYFLLENHCQDVTSYLKETLQYRQKNRQCVLQDRSTQSNINVIDRSESVPHVVTAARESTILFNLGPVLALNTSRRSGGLSIAKQTVASSVPWQCLGGR